MWKQKYLRTTDKISLKKKNRRELRHPRITGQEQKQKRDHSKYLDKIGSLPLVEPCCLAIYSEHAISSDIHKVPTLDVDQTRFRGRRWKGTQIDWLSEINLGLSEIERRFSSILGCSSILFASVGGGFSYFWDIL